MTLQSSGAISLASIAAVVTDLGSGSTPHSMSEYYKGGSLVPSTVAETVTAASLSGSVYDGRGGIYTTYPAINSGGYDLSVLYLGG